MSIEMREMWKRIGVVQRDFRPRRRFGLGMSDVSNIRQVGRGTIESCLGETMKILVACEFSGIVRDAFIKRGHDAISCDLIASEKPGPHIKSDVTNLLVENVWDEMIAFPPCAHLAVSGARWFKEKEKEQIEAIQFVKKLLNAPISRIALENPISILSTVIRKPDQIIQPWQFGHPETKATCLWLKNLPKLVPTNIVSGREHRIHEMPPSPTRSMDRSRTYQGIADAMAEQWGRFAPIDTIPTVEPVENEKKKSTKTLPQVVPE